MTRFPITSEHFGPLIQTGTRSLLAIQLYLLKLKCRGAGLGAEGSGGGAGSSGRGVVLEERQNAARESRGASSCSPSPNLLLLPKCPCRAHGHSGTPHVGACCAGRPGRCCASASRRRKLDPGSRFVSRATGRAHAPMREDLPVRRRGLVLGAGGRACKAESASGSGHRVPNHSLTFMCRCVPVI